MERKPEVATRSVELVYFEGCPHWHTALDRLKVALELIGLDISVGLQLVTDEGEARAHHMASSPTILVDGHDPFPGGGSAWGCRVYPGEAGLEGSPSVSELVAALTR